MLIKKILIHLGLWETRNHDPPQSNETHTPTIETERTYDYTYLQLPPSIIGPNKGLFNNSIPSGGHTGQLRLKFAFLGYIPGRSCRFSGSDNNAYAMATCPFHPAQHAVLTIRLTHYHRFDILGGVKSKFLSFYLKR